MSAVMERTEALGTIYERKGGELVHDQRAHERLIVVEKSVVDHTVLLTKMETAMTTQTKCLEKISKSIAPVVGTLMVAGWMRKAVMWVSPVILVVIAIWGAYYQYVHSHV